MLENPRFIGRGIYSVADAARLTKVSRGRASRWLRGYTYRSGEDFRESGPVWRSDLPPVDGQLALSFLDLIEVRFVDAFLKNGVPWKTIRSAAINAMEYFGQGHPLSNKRFKTDGQSIFLEVVRSTGDVDLLDMAKNQYAFRRVISPSLYTGLDFSESNVAVRWWPLGQRRRIVIDPNRSFGRPIISKSGVPTGVIAAAVRTEGSVSRVAKWFEIDQVSAKAAMAFEERLAA